MIRTMLLSLLFAPVIGAAAQQPAPPAPPAGSNWQRVQALPVGTSIQLNAGKRHQDCTIRSVDAETLTCAQGKQPTYQRSEITSIKISRRGRSTLIAMGVGAGVGAIVGAASSPGCGSQTFCIVDIGRGAGAAIVGIAGAVIGAPIGFFTDLNRSTIYKAP